MKLEINITADPSILEALNNIAEAIKGTKGNPPPVAVELEADTGMPMEEARVLTGLDKPKRTRKTKEAPATPEPQPETPITAEPQPTEEPIDPKNLIAKTKSYGFTGTEYTTRLRQWMDQPESDGGMGLKDVQLSKVTDQEKLKQIAAKIEELNAEKEALSNE